VTTKCILAEEKVVAEARNSLIEMVFSRLELVGAARTEVAARRRDAVVNFMMLIEFGNGIFEM
jgi:hypothetical protein